MATDTKVMAALDTLGQYREEGVILQSTIDELRGQGQALDRWLGALDTSSPERLASSFVDLRERFEHTRQMLDVAIDFLDKATEELGGQPPYDDKAYLNRVVAEEQ